MNQIIERKKGRRSSPSSDSDMSNMVYGKVPPQAKELEEAVLGAMMIERSSFEIVSEILTPECFYVDSHQRIYRAIQSLARKNNPIDMLTVVNELKSTEELDMVGGPVGIVKLTNKVVSSANVEAHALIVKQKFFAREMIRISGEFMQKAYDESMDVFDVMAEYEKTVMGLGGNAIEAPMIHMSEVMMQAVKKVEYWRSLESSMTGVTSGFKEIDLATRGWQGGDLIIIAARPSVGKTAFALNLARNAAASGVGVAMFSLEMNAVSQGLRMLSAESELWMIQIQTGRLDERQMLQMFEKGIKPLSNLPIYFEDNFNVTVGKFKAAVRRMVKKKGVKLVIVDYLQLMHAENKKASREQQISEISREMKGLANELQVPIIALSQLSREVEKRTNQEPQLSDLRESGAIEQDADLVAFLWAPTEEDVKRDPSLAKIRHFKIAKHRNGVLIKENLRFLNQVQKFTDPVPEGLPEGNWKSIPKDPTPAQGDLPF
jgi:replicative DNA helicase